MNTSISGCWLPAWASFHGLGTSNPFESPWEEIRTGENILSASCSFPVGPALSYHLSSSRCTSDRTPHPAQVDCRGMGSLRRYMSPFGTSCQHSAFITQIERPVYYILNPLSSPITLMWYHLSLLECRNKNGGVRAWQHLSECCKYLFEILDYTGVMWR